ncbi:SMI1/KNR4 family protein [Selenomonas ruminantium]|uniref:SMI1 / KNR4 family (SUKH-1) n=1 Tax=Selenomonas ruminantium TaxID=971 RepID=A0A1K1LW17_SELRU|nr:SMI1/KNR4 family protein [Selenomonas ruminantium]SFW15063.1 SMI1 / KNR4 family (SUKH-1) [Selenomonas ruminantium]
MNNKINSSYLKIGNAEIVRAEKLLGISLPESMKKFYLENNGGMPECDVLPENWSGAGHLDFIPYK